MLPTAPSLFPPAKAELGKCGEEKKRRANKEDWELSGSVTRKINSTFNLKRLKIFQGVGYRADTVKYR